MKTVLVVDDSSTNIDILLETLRYDYKVKIATSGAKALKVVEESDNISLILLDIMMPEMDGYAVCRKLQASRKYKDIPIIFVTALSEIGNETKGFQLGAVDYITKPFSPPVVRARVKTQIELNEKSKQLDTLLEQTLGGGIKSVTEMLAATRPTAYSKAQHFKKLFNLISSEFTIKDRWKFEIAASLSQIGCVFVDSEIVTKFYDGKPLSSSEVEQLSRYPDFSSELIQSIPFLQDVGKIIGQLKLHYDPVKWLEENPDCGLGLIILQALIFYDEHILIGISHKGIMESMNTAFPPQMVSAFDKIKDNYSADTIVMLWDLKPGMTLVENILSNDGAVLIPKGEQLTANKLKTLMGRWKSLKNRTIKISY